MIRTGRPAFHIKACTISFRTPNGDIEFYELDQKGELIKSGHNKKIVPHHIVKSTNLQLNQNQDQNKSLFQAPNLYYNQQYQNQQFQHQQYLPQQYFQQKFQQQQNNEQQIDQEQNKEQFVDSNFDINDEMEESSTLLFGMDLNNDFDFSFITENEVDWT